MADRQEVLFPANQEEEEVNLETLTEVHNPMASDYYQIVDVISTSDRTIVYKAIWMPVLKFVVAIKSIKIDNLKSNVQVEGQKLTLISHPNLLNSYYFFTHKRRLWVVMPLMSPGSLQSIISSSFQNGLPEHHIAVILKFVLNALSYLHNIGRIHGDIKANNILIDSIGSVMLSDYGCSKSCFEYESNANPASSGTKPYWVPPEVKIQSLHNRSQAHDIWAFGITALELAYGAPPLSRICCPVSKFLVSQIKKRFKFLEYKQINEEKKINFSKAFKDMVACCLNQDPSKRPNVEKLLKHEFFDDNNNDLGTHFQKLTILEKIKYYLEEEEDNTDDNGGESNIEKAEIIGWELNEDGFELDPVFSPSAGKRVAHESDESIITVH